MATVNYSQVANTLQTRFMDEIIEQINRSTVAMQLFEKGPGTTGKRLDWGVSFGTAVGAARAEGADVASFNDDDKEPATLDFGNYDDAFKITGKAIRAAAAAGNPRQLAALFNENMMDSIERLAKGINQDLYSGSGATNFIHGMTASAGPLDATGTYANIDRGSFAQWASNELLNGGVLRALTLHLMREMRRTIREASGKRPDLIITSPAIFEKYAEIFDTERRWVDQIRMRGQEIKLDGGHQVLEFDGIPMFDDVDCPDNDMLFLNTRFMKVKQLPDVGAGNPAQAQVNLRGTPEEQLNNRSRGNIVARVNPLARSGDYVNFQLICYPQLQSTRCNVHGRLGDLDIS